MMGVRTCEGVARPKETDSTKAQSPRYEGLCPRRVATGVKGQILIRSYSQALMGLLPKAATQLPSGPCVFYAVAKAIKKGEDFFCCLPAQPWPEGAPNDASDAAYGLYVLVDGALPRLLVGRAGATAHCTCH
jgi:hypothetical protein